MGCDGYHPTLFHSHAYHCNGMDATIIVTNASVAGKHRLAGDTPASTRGALLRAYPNNW